MDVKELISMLKDCPDYLPVRLLIKGAEDDDENKWLTKLEFSGTGESGYEVCGEVRLIGNS